MWQFFKRQTRTSLSVNCSNTAVIIVDMQEYFLNRLLPKVRKRIIDAQLALIADCACKHIPIIILEYEGYGKTIDELTQALKAVECRTTIEKNYDDGFLDTPLNRALEQIDAKSLIFMGINASYCVFATAKSAAKQGYAVLTSVELIADSHREGIAETNVLKWYEENCCFRPMSLLSAI